MSTLTGLHKQTHVHVTRHPARSPHDCTNTSSALQLQDPIPWNIEVSNSIVQSNGYDCALHMTATFAQLASQHVSFWRSGMLPTCVRLTHTVEDRAVKSRPEYAGFTMRQDDMQAWRLFLCIFLKAFAHHQDRLKNSGACAPALLPAVDSTSCLCNSPHEVPSCAGRRHSVPVCKCVRGTVL